MVLDEISLASHLCYFSQARTIGSKSFTQVVYAAPTLPQRRGLWPTNKPTLVQRSGVGLEGLAGGADPGDVLILVKDQYGPLHQPRKQASLPYGTPDCPLDDGRTIQIGAIRRVHAGPASQTSGRRGDDVFMQIQKSRLWIYNIARVPYGNQAYLTPQIRSACLHFCP